MHTSPRKLRLVADMAKKLHPSKAISVLNFTPQSAAKDFTKAIETALANAKQQGLSADVMYFKSVEINEGPKMRRFRAGSKGMALPYKRRMSHIKIVLSDETSEEGKGKSVKGKVRGSKKEVNQEVEDKKGNL